MTLYIIAGANSSGKTTFATELDKDNLTKYKIKAGKIFFQKLKSSLSLFYSFVIETTLSGKYLVKYHGNSSLNDF